MSSNEEMNKLTAQELIRIKLAIAEHKQSMEIMQSQLLMLRANIDSIRKTVHSNFTALMQVKSDVELERQDHDVLSARLEHLSDTLMSFSNDLHTTLFNAGERFNHRRLVLDCSESDCPIGTEEEEKE